MTTSMTLAGMGALLYVYAKSRHTGGKLRVISTARICMSKKGVTTVYIVTTTARNAVQLCTYCRNHMKV